MAPMKVISDAVHSHVRQIRKKCFSFSMWRRDSSKGKALAFFGFNFKNAAASYLVLFLVFPEKNILSYRCVAMC